VSGGSASMASARVGARPMRVRMFYLPELPDRAS